MLFPTATAVHFFATQDGGCFCILPLALNYWQWEWRKCTTSIYMHAKPLQFLACIMCVGTCICNRNLICHTVLFHSAGIVWFNGFSTVFLLCQLHIPTGSHLISHHQPYWIPYDGVFKAVSQNENNLETLAKHTLQNTERGEHCYWPVDLCIHVLVSIETEITITLHVGRKDTCT